MISVCAVHLTCPGAVDFTQSGDLQLVHLEDVDRVRKTRRLCARPGRRGNYTHGFYKLMIEWMEYRIFRTRNLFFTLLSPLYFLKNLVTILPRYDKSLHLAGSHPRGPKLATMANPKAIPISLYHAMRTPHHCHRACCSRLFTYRLPRLRCRIQLSDIYRLQLGLQSSPHGANVGIDLHVGCAPP